MKKALLATIGLAGPCAAYCAVPVLVSVISGLSVASLARLDWDRLLASREYLASALGVAVAGYLARHLVGPAAAGGCILHAERPSC